MCMNDDDRKGRLYAMPGPNDSGDAGGRGFGPEVQDDPRDMFSSQDLLTVATVTLLRLVDSKCDRIAYLAAASLMDIAAA